MKIASNPNMHVRGEVAGCTYVVEVTTDAQVENEFEVSIVSPEDEVSLTFEAIYNDLAIVARDAGITAEAACREQLGTSSSAQLAGSLTRWGFESMLECIDDDVEDRNCFAGKYLEDFAYVSAGFSA